MLWYLNGLSDDEARARDERRGQIELAIQTYENATEQYEDRLAIRKDCIDDVNGRNNTINNLRFIESFIRSIDEAAANEFRRQVDNQPNNQPKSIEVDCRSFEIPDTPTIPQILIDEGLLEPDNTVSQTD